MLIQADASQLEFRVLVELAQDQVALDEILNGKDTHSLNQTAFSLPSRLIAKIYLFRTIFRGTGWSFANDPDFMHVSSDPDYWDNVNTLFYQKYEDIDVCHNNWLEEVKNTGQIVGPFGRFWKIALINKYGKINWTQLTNYPVQGTGADLMALARVSFAGRLKKSGLDKEILLISSVHDSIVCDSPSKYLTIVATLFTEVFADLQKNIYKLFQYEWKTPLACEVKYGPNMKEMVKVTNVT
jgi:DNA polymerase-1